MHESGRASCTIAPFTHAAFVLDPLHGNRWCRGGAQILARSHELAAAIRPARTTARQGPDRGAADTAASAFPVQRAECDLREPRSRPAHGPAHAGKTGQFAAHV